MIGALVGLCFAGAYVALVVIIVRWGRRRLLRRAEQAAEALRAKGAKVFSVTPSPRWAAPVVVDFELDGKRGGFQVRRYGRDCVLLSVHVESPPLPAIVIRAEDATDRFGKALGLNREVQLGDADFDAAAYVVSNAPDDVVREVLKAPEARRLVREAFGLGYCVEMSVDGLRATRVQYGLDRFDAEPVPAVMRVLESLAPLLPRLDPSTITPPQVLRYSKPATAAAIFSIVIVPIFFATVPAMRPPVDDMNSLKVFGVGLVVWVVVMAALARLLRARPTGLLEFGLSALALFFGVPCATAALLFLANSGLDSSEPTVRTAQILSMYSGRDNRELRVTSWDPARPWQKVGVDNATFKALHKGDMVEIEMHPGALGWPWVSSVRRLF